MDSHRELAWGCLSDLPMSPTKKPQMCSSKDPIGPLENVNAFMSFLDNGQTVDILQWPARKSSTNLAAVALVFRP